ncbi:cytochrome P450, putative [Ricinus communis]|uniref:Cytochrome P450, putative n=1 Tax=Ricinus communis TaxID=3988 RepID=B9RMU5_RICCO|nr:cytochrome P450, putative [Ricinus communis]
MLGVVWTRRGWILTVLTGHHAKTEQAIDDHLKPERTKEQEDIVDVLNNKKAQGAVRNSMDKKRRVTEADLDQLQYLRLVSETAPSCSTTTP